VRGVEKLVPELRFSGFEGDWTLVKLGALLSFKNGLNASKEKYGRGVKFINVLDIINNAAITYDRIIGRIDITDKEFKRNEVVYGDILFQRSSETREEVGQANVYLDKEKSAVFGGFIIRGHKKQDYFPMFMNYLLKTSFARKEITTKSGGSTRYNVGQDTLNGVDIVTPEIQEQQKIASFLSAMDKKIEKLIRKKELLETYKKGVMQQIFSREIRFKDENGKDYPDWELKRGKDLFKNHSNKKHNGDLQILAATQNNGMVSRDTIGIKIQSSTQSVKSYKIVESGDFVISLRSFQGGIEYSELKGICSPAYIILKPKMKIEKYFFRHYFKKEDFITRLSKTVVGIRDGKQITYDAFSGLKFNVPSIFEQKKIATFLSTIDKKTEAVKTQLTQTQEFKKGLLQKMFV